VPGRLVSVSAYPFRLRPEGFSRIRSDFLDGRTSRINSVESRNEGGAIRARVLDHDVVFRHRRLQLNPACLTMLGRVPLATSSLGAPGTVTQLAFVGW
jgi:hypothetical protein